MNNNPGRKVQREIRFATYFCVYKNDDLKRTMTPGIYI